MRLKSFRTNTALSRTTFMLVVAAATMVATAQTYTDLFNFYRTDGAYPQGILAQGRDGNLYGTTEGGGISGFGIVFKITPGGKLNVIHKFDSVDGSYPFSGLMLGRDGNFYGTTYRGGNNDCGTIFKITKDGSLTTLYTFPDGADGCVPEAPPIQGADGNFYGTTGGGTGTGTAYKITRSGIFTLLGSIPGPSYAPLIQGTDGNFYGTTWVGGTNQDGTIFKVTPKGAVRIVFNFDSTHGAYPEYGSLIQGSDGNFYGTTSGGGNYGKGCVQIDVARSDHGTAQLS
jgi:uncharacterized repeat protein (TIGR03803 family)